MTPKRKKIIAREFLIFISSIVLGLIVYLAVFPYNALLVSQINHIEIEIVNNRQIVKRLEYEFNRKVEKQRWLFGKLSIKFDMKDTKTYKENWMYLSRIQQADSVIYMWNNKWNKDLIAYLKDIGFTNGNEFNELIKDNSLTQQNIEDNKEALKVKNEINIYPMRKKINQLENRKLDFKEQIHFGLICLIIIVGIVFPVRYLICSIHWSIKTLKEDK